MAQILPEYCNVNEQFAIIPPQTCVCCLAQNVPLIHLITCRHRSLLEFYSKFKINLEDCLVCCLCHGILKKIDIFIQQVQKSNAILNEKGPQAEKFEHYQYAQVAVLSVEPDVTLLPPEPTITMLPSEPDIIMLPPGPDVTMLPPEPDVIMLPPGPDVTMLPPESDVSILPTEPDVSILPPEPDVSILPPEPDVTMLPPEPEKQYEEIPPNEVILLDVLPLEQTNVLDFDRPELQTYDVNAELAIDVQTNLATIEEDALATAQIDENLIPTSNKCIKCQILYDDITLSDLERHSQLPNSNYVCSSCNLEFNSHLTPEDEILQYTSDSANLQRNTIEFHSICPQESCGNQIDNSNYVIEEQYENNGYSEYDRSEYDDYFEIGTEFVKKDSANHINITNNNIYNEITDNDVTNNDITSNEITDNVATDNDVTHNDNECTIKEKEPKAVTEKKKKKRIRRTGFKKVKLTLEEQKAELETKRKEKKYLDAEFKCYHCALSFLFKDTYQAHMMRHEESNGEHKCPTCTLRFASVTVLRAHTKLHLYRTECRRCGARPSPRHTQHHAAVCRGNVVTCPLCTRMFRYASGLQQHMKRYHQSKSNVHSFSCTVCGKNYTNQGAVRSHMIKHLNKKFACDKCSAAFNSPYTLNQHKKKHERETEQHYCDECNLAYRSRKSLLAHKRNALVHQQTVLECPVCKRVCPTQRSLSSHMSTVHSESKDHACPTCGARYTSRKSLVRHAATHTNAVKKQVVPTHACHRCPSMFKTRSKLNRHLRQVCEKDKLEQELSRYYGQNGV